MTTIMTTAAPWRAADISGEAQVTPLEEQLAAALAGLRAFAAASGEDDAYEAQARTLLDHRPPVLVGIALPSATVLWALEPGPDGRAYCHSGTSGSCRLPAPRIEAGS